MRHWFVCTQCLLMVYTTQISEDNTMCQKAHPSYTFKVNNGPNLLQSERCALGVRQGVEYTYEFCAHKVYKSFVQLKIEGSDFERFSLSFENDACIMRIRTYPVSHFTIEMVSVDACNNSFNASCEINVCPDKKLKIPVSLRIDADGHNLLKSHYCQMNLQPHRNHTVTFCARGLTTPMTLEIWRGAVEVVTSGTGCAVFSDHFTRGERKYLFAYSDTCNHSGLFVCTFHGDYTDEHPGLHNQESEIDTLMYAFFVVFLLYAVTLVYYCYNSKPAYFFIRRGTFYAHSLKEAPAEYPPLKTIFDLCKSTKVVKKSKEEKKKKKKSSNMKSLMFELESSVDARPVIDLREQLVASETDVSPQENHSTISGSTLNCHSTGKQSTTTGTTTGPTTGPTGSTL